MYQLAARRSCAVHTRSKRPGHHVETCCRMPRVTRRSTGPAVGLRGLPSKRALRLRRPPPVSCPRKHGRMSHMPPSQRRWYGRKGVCVHGEGRPGACGLGPPCDTAPSRQAHAVCRVTRSAPAQDVHPRTSTFSDHPSRRVSGATGLRDALARNPAVTALRRSTLGTPPSHLERTGPADCPDTPRVRPTCSTTAPSCWSRSYLSWNGQRLPTAPQWPGKRPQTRGPSRGPVRRNSGRRARGVCSAGRLRP